MVELPVEVVVVVDDVVVILVEAGVVVVVDDALTRIFWIVALTAVILALRRVVKSPETGKLPPSAKTDPLMNFCC